jgi:Tfp pilus assembly protein PilX
MTLTRNRRGIAAVWVLVVFAVFTVLSAGLLRQAVYGRRAQAAREARAQATWLARSGVELAAARLAADGDRYTGEEVKPLPGSVLTITAAPDGTTNGAFRVTVEARFHPPAGSPVVRTVSRTVTP